MTGPIRRSGCWGGMHEGSDADGASHPEVTFPTVETTAEELAEATRVLRARSQLVDPQALREAAVKWMAGLLSVGDEVEFPDGTYTLAAAKWDGPEAASLTLVKKLSIDTIFVTTFVGKTPVGEHDWVTGSHTSCSRCGRSWQACAVCGGSTLAADGDACRTCGGDGAAFRCR